ncbi:hypothetical protein [Moorena producens]
MRYTVPGFREQRIWEQGTGKSNPPLTPPWRGKEGTGKKLCVPH